MWTHVGVFDVTRVVLPLSCRQQRVLHFEGHVEGEREQGGVNAPGAIDRHLQETHTHTSVEKHTNTPPHVSAAESNLLVHDGHSAVEASSAARVMIDLAVSETPALHPRQA